MSPRKPKLSPMLEMADPEIVARMENSTEMKAPRRVRRSKGFEKQLREAGRTKIATPAPAEQQNDDDPFAEARKPARGIVWRSGELNDYDQMKPIPASGKCTCGSRPYSWTDARGFSRSKHNPEIAFYCSSIAHGGNGKFWLFSGQPLPKRGRPRKALPSVQPEKVD